MSESKKKAKVQTLRDAQGRFTKRNFPEPLYDVMCDIMQDSSHICSFAHLHTPYTPTIIGHYACLTSTIAPLRLSPIFGPMACVCKRFRDVLRRFRAKSVEVVVAHINYDLLRHVKYVIDCTNILPQHMNLEWELMFHEQIIYRIRAYHFDGFVTFFGVSQNCNSQVCRRIKFEQAAIEAMTMDARVSKRDEILNLLWEDLQTWPTLSPLSDQDKKKDLFLKSRSNDITSASSTHRLP